MKKITLPLLALAFFASNSAFSAPSAQKKPKKRAVIEAPFSKKKSEPAKRVVAPEARTPVVEENFSLLDRPQARLHPRKLMASPELPEVAQPSWPAADTSTAIKTDCFCEGLLTS